jgi:outer membrane protein OmpA-like peptidoglycan-associated protein/opacity protein-like surface antigen
MRMRVLLATGALAAIVPALAAAQQRPATPPARPQPAARPAAQPAQRPAARPAAGAAHREGSIELSLGAGLFRVDGHLRSPVLAAAAQIGADPGQFMPGGAFRLGYNLTPKLGVSAGSGVFFGSNSTTALSPFAALTYTADLNKKMSPFVTVGAGMTRFSANSKSVTASYGGHLGVGVRSMLGENLALRVEGRMAYERYSETGGYSAYNSTGTLGLSYFMGGGPPPDTDADGVPDKRDRCASTPAGATVDLRGCPSDTDRDGVYNGLDRCPNTPANTPVTADGCTRDTDNDGIADNLDRCANTPANARPIDASGCPVDTDRDAVFDYLDTCPNTAAGTQVDASGCPVARDADRDGVIDANDRCPNTPAAARVDLTGCPLAELPAVNAALVIRNITFRAGTSRLLPTSFAELDRVAIALIATPNSRWEIGGHTDATGVAAANLRLSQARAQAVMAYLVSKDVPAAAMTAVGYGSTRAIAPNTRASGRAQNRRVEIKRLS